MKKLISLVSIPARNISTARLFESTRRLLRPIDESKGITYGLQQVLTNEKIDITEVQKKFEMKEKPSEVIKTIHRKDLEELYDYIQTNVVIELQLALAPGHYFQIKGKMVRYDICLALLNLHNLTVRPLINYALSDLLYAVSQGTPNSNKRQSEQTEAETFESQTIWASVIELLHISSLVHDDIIDNATSRRGLECVHTKYGRKEAVFAGNFLVGRGVKAITTLKDPLLFQVYATIMDNLTSVSIFWEGEYIQAKRNKNFNNMERLLQDYLIKSYYKTGSLISNSCRGVAILLGAEEDTQNSAFRFGQHLGIAFQLIDDVLDYTQTTEQLGKKALADLKEGIITGPSYLALHELSKDPKQQEAAKTLSEIYSKRDLSDEDVETCSKIISKTHGIQNSTGLAYLHMERALEYVEEIKNKALASNQTIDLALHKIKAIMQFILQRTH